MSYILFILNHGKPLRIHDYRCPRYANTLISSYRRQKKIPVQLIGRTPQFYDEALPAILSFLFCSYEPSTFRASIKGGRSCAQKVPITLSFLPYNPARSAVRGLLPYLFDDTLENSQPVPHLQLCCKHRTTIQNIHGQERTHSPSTASVSMDRGSLPLQFTRCEIILLSPTIHLIVCRAKRMQSTGLCRRRPIPACLDAMAKVSIGQELRRLHTIQAQVFPDPLSAHQLTRKLTERDLHFIFTNLDLPMEFPRRFLVTLPRKCLPPSATMLSATLKRIRTRTRILSAHPLNSAIPR
jgi:hypothetical protein